MRYLLITSDAYGCSGGIAQYNRDLAEALSGMAGTHHVRVVARNLHFGVGPLPTSISFEILGTGGISNFFRAVGRQFLERWDLVICGHINLLPFAVVGAWLSSCPVVLMAYGIDVWEPPRSRLARWLARRVDAVWSISEYTRLRAGQWLAIDPARYRLLPNAIRLDRYGTREVIGAKAARFRGNATHMILTLGRLASSERYKGIDEVLEVLPAILPAYPGLRYVVAGDGDDRPRLERRVSELGLKDHVYFPGFIGEEDKADLYRLADVFAMPGRGEGFGFVFLEAMACGTPVLASTRDGSFEAVRFGELGLAIDPDDPIALREGLLAALTRPRGIPPGLDYFSFDQFGQRLAQAVGAHLPIGPRLASNQERS